MATPTYEFENSASTTKKVSSAQTNHDWNTVEEVLHAIADILGAGILNASDFNLTPTGGAAKTGSVNGGVVVTGQSNQKRIKVVEDPQNVTCVGTNASPQTNYCYVGQDGTLTIVQNVMDAPANSHQAWSCLCNDAGLSAVNQLPSARRNLVHALGVLVSSGDRQADYLFGKLVAGAGVTITKNNAGAVETITIAANLTGLADEETVEALPEFEVELFPGDRILLEVDFSTVCDFPDGRYAVFTNLLSADDESEIDPGHILVTEMIENKSGTVCYLLVEVACDAAIGAGSIPTNDVIFQVTLVGHEHSDNAGSTVTVTPIEIDSTCGKPYDIAFHVPDEPASSARVLKFVAPRDIVLPVSLTGSRGHADIAATAQTDFSIKKNGVSIGTIRWAAAGTVPTYIFAAEVSLAAADRLTVDAPASPDATLAGIAVTIVGETGYCS